MRESAMGFKSWITDANKTERLAKQRDAKFNLKCISTFEFTSDTIQIDSLKGTIKYGRTETVDLARIGSIEFSDAVPEKRMTATRILVGGAAFGLLGAAVGALLKKKTNSGGYVLIDVLLEPGGEIETQWLLVVKRNKATEARQVINDLRNIIREANRD